MSWNLPLVVPRLGLFGDVGSNIREVGAVMMRVGRIVSKGTLFSTLSTDTGGS